MDVNANGVFYCVKEQLNMFMKNGTKGSIVNVSSIAGRRPLWLGSAYGMSAWTLYDWTSSN